MRLTNEDLPYHSDGLTGLLKLEIVCTQLALDSLLVMTDKGLLLELGAGRAVEPEACTAVTENVAVAGVGKVCKYQAGDLFFSLYRNLHSSHWLSCQHRTPSGCHLSPTNISSSVSIVLMNRSQDLQSLPK